jgi:hypothetical protein
LPPHRGKFESGLDGLKELQLITDIVRTAHHEAGHVVVGYRWLGELPLYIEVRTTNLGQGGCMWDAKAPLVNHRHVSPKDRERLEQWVAMLTAGDAAAETLTGRRWPALCMDDKVLARLYVSRYLPGITETIDVEIERQRREAMSFFAQPRHWAEVKLIARALLEAANQRLERPALLALLAGQTE